MKTVDPDKNWSFSCYFNLNQFLHWFLWIVHNHVHVEFFMLYTALRSKVLKFMKLAITMMYVGFWIDSREDVRGYSALSWVWDTEAVTEVPVRAEVPTGCRLSRYLQSTATSGKQWGPLTVVKQYVSYSLKYEVLLQW